MLLEETVFDVPLKKAKGFQAGGFTGAVPNQGQPGTGDHFYTSVDPGSYILNRNAVAGLGFQSGGQVPVALEQGEIALPPGAYDRRVLDFLNYEMFPRFQKGGNVPCPPSDVVDSQRYLATTDAIKRSQGFLKGGVVLFKGHGDVPAGQAQGTDGPGTDLEGKYQPNAEQYFVEQVAQKAASMSDKVVYAPPAGKFADSGDGQSNWSRIAGLRQKNEAAIELHFDAYGKEGGKMIVGNRGMLIGNRSLLDIEKRIEKAFGTHPLSGSKGWGTLMLELDPVNKAVGNIEKYAKMIVDAVEGNSTSPSEDTEEDAAIPAERPQSSPGNDGENPAEATTGIMGMIAKGVGDFLAAEGGDKFGLGAGTLLGAMFGGRNPLDNLLGGDANAATLDQAPDYTSDARGDGPRPQVGQLPPNARAKEFYKQLIKDGVPAAAAAGIVGNIQAESAFDPAVIEKGTGIGRGLIQWSYERRTNFENYCKRNKINPNSMQANYEYLMYEMKGNDGNHWLPAPYTPRGMEVRSYEEFVKKATTPAKAAKLFMYNYERPNKRVAHLDRRIASAKGVAQLQRGGLVNMNGAVGQIMQTFIQNNQQHLEEEAMADQPIVMNMGGDAGGGGPSVSVKTLKTNMPMGNLQTRDNCPLSIYYRFHPSFNPQGMSP